MKLNHNEYIPLTYQNQFNYISYLCKNIYERDKERTSPSATAYTMKVILRENL